MSGGVLRRLVANGTISAATLDRIRSEQLSVVAINAQVGAIAAPAAAVILALSLIHDGLVPPRTAEIWVAIIAASHALGFISGYACRRRRNPHASWRPWARLIVAATAGTGLSWGVGSLFLIAHYSAELHLWVAVVLSAVVAGSAIAFGSYLPVFYAVLFPALVPHILWPLLQGGTVEYRLGALAALYVAALAVAGRHFNGVFIDALRLRFEKLELVDQLRLEKMRAEQANIDKSRFLAAASHDLRQPVHALSMFVGALQAHELNASLRQLADQMNKSVGALDDLFGSLLDISRFDANVIEVRRQVFPIGWLIERVCHDQRIEARAKGLRLAVHPSSLMVRTDPVLMERILRNLVSNAVRYTMSGRVIVGCRRGQPASVQVWDTGPGIPIEEQHRIFDEFYQLGNPERDRDKGLGLGLAIVKRSAELLGCQLNLCSKAGAGSVFKIAIPVANEALAEIVNERAAPLAPATGGVILVVDDEAAVQAAMSSLLSRWGYQVIAAGSAAELLRKTGTSSVKPRLIICDYRLRGRENGAAAVRRLRSEYNDNIPALLITGDTAPARLKDAQASGLPLLHKPVTGARLQAALAKLLSEEVLLD
jgi:signal transduction histidine kinase/ActR/RegA family two-component response regulator